MARKRRLLLGYLQSVLGQRLGRLLGRQQSKRRPSRLLLFRLRLRNWRTALIGLGLAAALIFHGLPATARQDAPQLIAQTTNPTLRFYEGGRFSAAAAALELEAARYEENGDVRKLGAALGNLALAYQKLGQWEAAEAASARSLEVLQSLGEPTLLARSLSVRGGLQLERGDGQAALVSWEAAEVQYEAAEDTLGVLKSQVNQAQALQELGFYRRAVALLSDLPIEVLPPAERMIALRNLGEAQRVMGKLVEAKRTLDNALPLAASLADPEALAQAQLSLGNLYRSLVFRTRALGKNPNASSSNFLTDDGALLSPVAQALSFYEQAIATTTSDATRLQTQVYRLQLLTINPSRWAEAQPLARDLLSALSRQPVSRSSIYLQLEFVDILEAWQRSEAGISASAVGLPSPSSAQFEELLVEMVEQTGQLGDRRLRAYAIGRLGQFYERTDRLDEAARLTDEALQSAQRLNATDLAYRWHWQAGRIFKQQGNRERAIAAYKEALDDLELLRSDLTAVGADAQFSFQNTVEPVHRELVDLLLPKNEGVEGVATVADGTRDADLEKARQVIDSLQVAELNNFFREACLDNQPVSIESVAEQAAVIYPIILPDRLEVIASLPQGDEERLLLRHEYFYESSAVVDQTTANILRAFARQDPQDRGIAAVPDPSLPRDSALLRQQARDSGSQLYRWIIEPIEAQLAESQVETLVFVLDGSLRNVPMAALYDGNQYLVERYSLALTPGLQLLDSKAIADVDLNVLLVGMSEGFNPPYGALPGVKEEMKLIEEIADHRTLLNQDFTREAIQAATADRSYPIVHLATHGQFSSEPEDTFIISWGGDRITVDEIGKLLQTSEVRRQQPIELLVMSACDTAEGDKQAALGLAGVAIRSGARSTVGSLWELDDNAAPQMMAAFYRALQEPGVTKAEALRQAQLAMLKSQQYQSPEFWVPVVLVGNWR